MDNTAVLYYLNRQGGGARSVSLSVEAKISSSCGSTAGLLYQPTLLGEVTCPGGFTQQSSYSPSQQMGLRQERASPCMRVLVLTTSGPFFFCDLVQQPTPNACDPSARSGGVVGRRSQHSVLSHSRIRLPPDPSLMEVPQEAREQATLILVAPMWQAQAWFSELMFLYYFCPISLRSKITPSA